jgi:hypothetical protein
MLFVAAGLSTAGGCATDEGTPETTEDDPVYGGIGRFGTEPGGGRAGSGGTEQESVEQAAAAITAMRDQQALLACASAEPCAASPFVQLVENAALNVSAGVSCVLSALAQRTPGRYRYLAESVASNGNITAEYTLLVAADGSLAYTRVARSTSGLPMNGLGPASGQRCQLRPASYFEGCQAALAAAAAESGLQAVLRSAEEAWSCSYGSGDSITPGDVQWFESCEVESPPACD